MLFVRLLRSLWMFARVFCSYLLHAGLMRMLRTEEDVMIRAWLVRRRARVDQANAEFLYASILKLGGVFIKMGQVLSMMGGVLPATFAERLSRLQDQVPPRPFEDMAQTFTRTFGENPRDVLALDPVPVAAASLGQVHRGQLPDGRAVAVKIMYPRMRQIVATDLDAIRWAMMVYRIFLPLKHLERVHDSLTELLERETDYRIEAQAMTRFANNFADERDFVCPTVIHEWSARDVLTMTYCEGIKISDRGMLEARGVDCRVLANVLIRGFYKQIFIDRFIHADPHPGNFLVSVSPEGQGVKVAVLDFGAASVVSDRIVEGMLDALQGLLTSNGALLITGLRRMGFISQTGNRVLLESVLMAYFRKIFNVKDRSPAALFSLGADKFKDFLKSQLGDVNIRELLESIEYPEGWFYLERACVMMFWLCAELAPDVDTMRVGIPYVLGELNRRSATRSKAA